MGISDRKRSIDFPVNINLDLNQEAKPNQFLVDNNFKGGDFVSRKKSGNVFAGSKLYVDNQGIYNEKNITPDLFKKFPKQTPVSGGNPPSQTPSQTPSTTPLTCDFTYVVGSITNTPTPTPTVTPTNTVTPTPTPTNTLTPTPTTLNCDIDYYSLPTPTPTRTPTNTPTPTRTPTHTPTSTPTETPTETPIQTPTNTPTNSVTPTETPTMTPTETPTETPTQTPTNTPTVTNTQTPTMTPTPSPLPPIIEYFQDCCAPFNVYKVGGFVTPITLGNVYYINTDGFNGCVTAVSGPLFDAQYNIIGFTAETSCLNCTTTYPCIPLSPTPTPTNTQTPTLTPNPTPTNTQTPTQTPTSTRTPTPTRTQTPTNTRTPNNTPTNTRTPNNTPTNTLTPTNTPTPTGTMPSSGPIPTCDCITFTNTVDKVFPYTYTDCNGNTIKGTIDGLQTITVCGTEPFSADAVDITIGKCDETCIVDCFEYAVYSIEGNVITFTPCCGEIKTSPYVVTREDARNGFTICSTTVPTSKERSEIGFKGVCPSCDENCDSYSITSIEGSVITFTPCCGEIKTSPYVVTREDARDAFAVCSSTIPTSDWDGSAIGFKGLCLSCDKNCNIYRVISEVGAKITFQPCCGEKRTSPYIITEQDVLPISICSSITPTSDIGGIIENNGLCPSCNDKCYTYGVNSEVGSVITFTPCCGEIKTSPFIVEGQDEFGFGICSSTIPTSNDPNSLIELKATFCYTNVNC
jgi:hypothetical protein